MTEFSPGPLLLKRGPLEAQLIAGELRGLKMHGVEVLRGLSVPIRDPDWGRLHCVTLEAEHGPHHMRHRFRSEDHALEGELQITLTSDRQLEARFHLEARRATAINRAGLTLLHPLSGVCGQPLRVLHHHGPAEDIRFPDRISPGQPATNISGLCHRVHGIGVEITFHGELFELEDQRNWSDASFKTYCRPLALPHPFTLNAGQRLSQGMTMRLEGQPVAPRPRARPPRRVLLPQIELAHDIGARLPASRLPLLARMLPETTEAALAELSGRALAGVEIIFDTLEGLSLACARLIRHRISPARVIALPRPWLASHQPGGIWPEGPTPADAISRLRMAFPAARIGGGSLTHFAEANRWPPASCTDFVTFGSAAIVNAADEASVIETLETLPQILASGQALLPGKPMHLGLIALGLRSNPHGRRLMPNPEHRLMTMTNDDPRQATDFAAAWACAVLALAADAGVASLALAMTDGPQGARGTPLGAFLERAGALAGEMVEIETHVDRWSIRSEREHWHVRAGDGLRLCAAVFA